VQTILVFLSLITLPPFIFVLPERINYSISGNKNLFFSQLIEKTTS